MPTVLSIKSLILTAFDLANYELVEHRALVGKTDNATSGDMSGFWLGQCYSLREDDNVSSH